MKKQTILKSTLCLLFTLMCHVAWAAVTDLPQMSNEGTIKWYTIRNTRSTSGQYLYWTENGVKDANAKKLSSLFYFTGTAEECYIHNAATNLLFTGVGAWNETGVKCKISVTPFGDGTTGLAIEFSGTALNERNTGNGYTTYGANDAGSVFVIEEAPVAQMVADYKTTAIAALDMIQFLGVDDEKAAINAIEANIDAFAAVDAIVNGVAQYVAFRNGETNTGSVRYNNYLAAYMPSGKGHGASTFNLSNATWSLKYSGEGSFYIYNVNQKVYLGNPGSNGALTEAPNSAYTFEVIEDNKVEFKSGGQTLHMNNHNGSGAVASGNALTNYDSDDVASRWYVETDFAAHVSAYKTSAIATLDGWKTLSVVFDAALIETAKTAINAIETTDYATFAAIDAELKKVTDAVAAKMITFQTIDVSDAARVNVWISANASTMKAFGAAKDAWDYNAVWSLQHAGGSSFYLYNELNSVYLGAPVNNTEAIVLTKAPTAAYTFEIIEGKGENVVEMHCNGGTIHASNHSDDKLISYDGNEDASRWMVNVIDITKDIKDLLATIEEGDYAEVPELGQYSKAGYDALVAAQSTAKTVEEVEAAIEAFKASLNRPVFFIESMKDYALGQSIYEVDASTLKFKTTDKFDKTMWWSFDIAATEVVCTEKVVVRNISSGNLFWEAEFISVIETEPAVEDDGIFMFKTNGTGKPVHAQESGSSIVRWSSNEANVAGGASTWKFIYVGNTYDLNKLTDEIIKERQELATLYNENINIGDKLGEGLGWYSETDEGAIATALAEARDILGYSPSEFISKGINKLAGIKNRLVDAKNGIVFNIPEAGKFYRICYDYGGEVGVKYLQGTTSGVSEKSNAMPLANDKGVNSIFTFEMKNGEMKMKPFYSDKYVREDDNARGLQTNGGKVSFGQREGQYGTLTINAPSSFHANTSGTTHFVDHCSSACGKAHDFVIEEIIELPQDGETYYIYIDTYDKNTSAYVNRFFYINESNELKTNTGMEIDAAAYKWTCSMTSDGYIQFRNGNGKYLSHKGISDDAYNFSLRKGNTIHGIAASLYSEKAERYFVVKNDGSAYDQADKIYDQTTTDWCTDFVFLNVKDIKVLSVNGDSKTNATVTWNGETKELPATWVITPYTTITNTTLSINSDVNFNFEGLYENGKLLGKTIDIEGLEQNRIITAKFSPAFFSKSTKTEDLVPVRIRNVRDNGYTLRLNASDNGYTGHAINSGVTAYGENEIWYLVGNEESFKIYHRIADTGLYVVLAGTGSGQAASMGNTDTNADFCLVTTNDGYAISPKGNKDQSFNMHGGKGNDIKLYNTTDGGSIWTIEKMDVDNTLTFAVKVDGKQPYVNNTRVAHLGTTIAGVAKNTIIKGNVDAATYYLPLGATFSLTNNVTYRGYSFDGFLDAKDNAAEYTNATLPEGGLNLTASYSVDEDNKYQYLFYYRDDVNNKPYRIPAITTARNNTVLAFSDYRPCSNDIGYGEVDIMLRRSYDNGKTWSDAVCIADGQGGDNNVFNVGFGDAAVVADRESGKVLVMAVAGKQVFGYGSATGHNSMAKIVSNDNGEQWSDPEDVTSQFMIEANSLFPEAYTMFFGSGRILQSRVYKAEGADYYRIYGALLVKHADNNNTDNCNFVVYSDDFGESWNILGGSITAGMCCAGGDEPKVEELPDGSIVLSSRKYNGRYFNIFKFTDIAKGEGSWDAAEASNGQTGGISFGGNSTNGEIYKVKAIRNTDGQICDVMLQSIPTGGGRSNVSVYYKEMSYDEAYTPTTFAQNWTKGLEVSAIGSAYSTMTLQTDGNFGFFYEEEPGDQWAYCMVYVPLSLEELTKGTYSLVHLELDENTVVVPQINKEFKQVVVNRTIKAPEAGKEYGNWNTFVVPFDMDIPDGWQVKKLVSSSLNKENISLVFGDANEGIKAGVPYMVRTKAAVSNIVVKDVAVDTELNDVATESVKFIGSYTSGYVPEGAFFISNNTFYRSAADNSNTIKAFRAYLMPTTEEGKAARSLSYRTDGETTAIDNSQLTNDNEVTVVAIYNLQGVRLDDMQEGVNMLQMSDGRVVKVVIK